MEHTKATDKDNLNREIAAQNKLLKEMKARITRLYNWSKENSKQPEKASILDFLKQQTQEKPTTQYGKVKALKESAALFHFLQSNGINSIAELHAKITAMQSDYYALRGEIVSSEREIATLAKHLEIWGQYGANKHPKTQDRHGTLTQKNAAQVFPCGISYFPNKSLCVPVRAKVKTRTSPSIQ